MDKSLVHSLLELADLNILGDWALSAAVRKQLPELVALMLACGTMTRRTHSITLQSLFADNVTERQTKLNLFL